MALKEDKQRAASLLFHESIDAGRRRTGQHAVAVRKQARFRHIVEPRMRHAHKRRRAGEQRMRTGCFAVEHARKLAGEPLTHDAVGVQHAGVCGETRPDGGDGVGARPIDKVAQRVPIRLVFQIGRNRLGAGDNQAVERSIP